MDINDLKKSLNNKSRLMGVDMGSKRVGISISDENRKIATPLKVLNYISINKLIEDMIGIILEHNVDGIILWKSIKYGWISGLLFTIS